MAADMATSVEGYQYSARRRSRLSTGLVVAVSIATLMVLFTYPNGPQAALLWVGIGFLVLTWFRPIVGIATILGLTIIIEQYDFAMFTPVTRRIPFFENASVITHIKGLEASPLELLLVVVTAIALTHLVLKRRSIRPNPLAVPVVVFGVAAALWAAFGMMSGGRLSVVLWELRALAYFMLLVLLLPQMIGSLRDVRLLLWVALLAVGVKAGQGVWNYVVTLHGDMTGVRSVTSHEDALFIAWMGVFLLALMLFKTGDWQRRALIALSPVMALGFVFTDRRAAYVAFALGAVVLSALGWTDRTKRSAIVKAGIPLVFLAVFIIAAGWNAPGILGRPAEMVRSIGAPDNQEDRDSSYYRRQEEVNLIHSIERNPVLGLGFGRAFQTPGEGGIVKLDFSLANEIPHNQIIWIWSKMGTFGFALFWVMIGSVIVLGGVVVRSAKEPYIRAVAALGSCAIAMQIVVSYVDLQLTYARNMVFLGVIVAILASLPSLSGEEVADAEPR